MRVSRVNSTGAASTLIQLIHSYVLKKTSSFWVCTLFRFISELIFSFQNGCQKKAKKEHLRNSDDESLQGEQHRRRLHINTTYSQLQDVAPVLSRFVLYLRFRSGLIFSFQNGCFATKRVKKRQLKKEQCKNYSNLNRIWKKN